jgi:hypothetical protein
VVGDLSSKSTVIWLLTCFFGCVKGYSWKTSQFGLAIDNIDSYELVLPDGKIKSITPQDADLWFGLRVCDIFISLPFMPDVELKSQGGFNNFVC